MERQPDRNREANTTQDLPPPEPVEEDEMDTSGHGDKLQSSVDRVAKADDEDEEKGNKG